MDTKVAKVVQEASRDRRSLRVWIHLSMKNAVIGPKQNYAERNFRTG
jgi:hypothetical protein